MYMIRHPTTEMNAQRITQGHADSPLTPEGEAIAQKVSEFLSHKRIKSIQSSDLGRCVQTAKIIQKIIQVDVHTTKQLREQNFGELNGHPAEEIRKTIDVNNWKERPPGGETMKEVQERTLRFLKQTDNDSLIIAHDGNMRSVLEMLHQDIYTSPLTILHVNNKNGNLSLLERIDLGGL